MIIYYNIYDMRIVFFYPIWVKKILLVTILYFMVIFRHFLGCRWTCNDKIIVYIEMWMAASAVFCSRNHRYQLFIVYTRTTIHSGMVSEKSAWPCFIIDLYIMNLMINVQNDTDAYSGSHHDIIMITFIHGPCRYFCPLHKSVWRLRCIPQW